MTNPPQGQRGCAACMHESHNVEVMYDANDDDTLQAVFKKQIDVFVEEGLDFVLCEVKLS